jgi:hypothetical protein
MLSPKKETESPGKDNSERPLHHSVNRGSMFEDQVGMDQQLQRWPWTKLSSPVLMQILIAQHHRVSDLIAQEGMHGEHLHGVS